MGSRSSAARAAGVVVGAMVLALAVAAASCVQVLGIRELSGTGGQSAGACVLGSWKIDNCRVR